MEERPLIEKYEMSLDYVGCHLGSDLMVAKLAVEPDLTDLLPYINAEAEKAKYIPALNWLKFKFRGYPVEHKGAAAWDVAIQKNTISVRMFRDKDTAALICKEVVDYINDLYRRKDEITPSYKEWVQPRALDIFKLLPKTNCKKCGEPTCMAFATKLVLERVSLEDCPELKPGSENYRLISEMFY
ncbi:MAG: (Fe-S)-binding protein [Thermacetogeniaceae bacterium]